MGIPSPESGEESEEELPELFLSQGSSQDNVEPKVVASKPSHYIPGVSVDSVATKSVDVPPQAKSVQLDLQKAPKPIPAIVAHTRDAGTPVSSRSILVNPRQSKNPVLKYIENCKYTFSDKIVPDFVLASTRCAIFISLKYHTENPGYLESRFRTIPFCFTLKVVLCFVDRPDSTIPLQHVSKLCIRHQCTLVCVWSNLEAARYLETYKLYENKPADSIMGKVEEDYESRLVDCMTSIRTVNKRDVKNLATTYGTLKRAMNADMEELSITEGLGTKKVKDIYYTFHKPFKPKAKAKQTPSTD